MHIAFPLLVLVAGLQGAAEPANEPRDSYSTRKPTPAPKRAPKGRMKHGFGAWLMGVHLGGGLAVQRPEGVLVVGIEPVHLSWRHIYWSVLESFMGISFPREADCQGSCEPRNAPRIEFLTAGTRIGYPLRLGPKKRHELRFGVGLAYASLDNLDAPSIHSFVLIPGIRYQISAFIASFQIILPTVYDRAHRYPASLFVSVGISLRNLNDL